MLSRFLKYFSPVAALKSLGKGFRERRCPACLQVHTGKGLCSNCKTSITLKPENSCGICGKELHSPDSDCITCQTSPRNFSSLNFYGMHTGLLREMIIGWKFNNNYGYNSLFQQFIGELCTQTPVDNTPDLIIPVPLHFSRLRERGFNQSLILARGVSSATGISISEKALIRVRKTIPQTRLSGSERRTNLLSAFIADHSYVADKKILLIDDVYTTGSTVDECALSLIEAGAIRVDVLTLSRALI